MAQKYLIALDDGHGMGTMGKRTPPLKEDLYINEKLVRKKGEVIKENEFNRAVVKYLEEALKRCRFNVLLVAPTDEDTPLTTRVNRANNAKADAYISKHYNAAGSQWQTKVSGLVTIIHHNSQAKTKVLANNIHNELWSLHQGNNCKNYKVRTDVDVSGFSLYVLNNTKMPAVLTESGFMDNLNEAIYMLDTQFQKKDAEATCRGICKTFNVTYIKPTDSSKNKDVEVPSDVKFVRIKIDGLNVRSKASWYKDAISGTVKKGEVFTVVNKVQVGNSYMYKLKSGNYITASTNYVEGLNSI